jgi:hypothetical protein
LPELESSLRALAADIAFPPTPSLAEAVADRLEPRRVTERRWFGRRRVAVAIAIALAAFAAVLAASPGARSAFLELFGIERATVYRVERAPDVNTYAPLVRGEAVTLADAQQSVDFDLRLPPTDAGGPIERVFLDRIVGAVTVVYCCPELLLTQFRGETLPYVQKVAGPDVEIEELEVEGSPAIWLEGAHAVVFRDAHGIVRDEELRLAGNVLLWERDGITYRLEGHVDREDAVRLAEALR